LKGICIRLALLMACVDAVTANTSMAAIGRDHLARAIKITDWFKHEARRVYGSMGEDDEGRDRRKLLELITRKGGSVSGRELVQSSRAFPTVDDADAALDALVGKEYGRWVQPDQVGRGGPKARRFVLNPVYSVNVYRNATDGTENGNTVDVNSVDTPETDAQDPTPDEMFEAFERSTTCMAPDEGGRR